MNQPRQDQRFKLQRTPYGLPLPIATTLGCIGATLFFALLIQGPFELALLKRYALSHWVCVVTVYLFSIGVVGLSIKWYCAASQTRLITRTISALRRLVKQGQEVSSSNRVDWMLESWRAEPQAVQSSWLGGRVVDSLQIQQSRGRRNHLEQDLKSLAESSGDQQHESYSLLRIVHWAMPMLGFLGTVLGISQTLGQLDTEALATKGQEAMNQLTAGLYVAFDTTAIALVLTMVSMFIQFGVNRIELRLMNRIDSEADSILVPFIGVDPFEAQDSLIVPVREMANDLINCVRELVVEQASVWSRSISESQRQWSEWTQTLASEVDVHLVGALGEAMSKHLAGLEQVQEKTGRQFETRLQQWQTTLSEQTRALHHQQKEMVQQTNTLQQLIQSTADLKKLEEAISTNLRTIEETGSLDKASGRIETATQCVAEAVAMLATSLERAGLVRAAPQRPRVARHTVDADAAESSTIPMPNPESGSGDQSDISTEQKAPNKRGKAA
ncbi:MAG: MotA/TolQ/ExbB proton channel family protein [Pirellulales bacterium]